MSMIKKDNRSSVRDKLGRLLLMKTQRIVSVCMVASRHQNAGRYHNVLIADKSSEMWQSSNTRAVCKVRGLTLLLRVGTLWRRGDGLFFQVTPLRSDALLTTLHPLLENALQTVEHFEISCLGAPFSWLEKPGNRMGRDLDCMADVLMRFHWSNFPSRTQNSTQILPPCDF
jgi:hypothetical protein